MPETPINANTRATGPIMPTWVADLRRRFWVCLVLSLPVVAIAPMIQAWLGLGDSRGFSGDSSIQFAFATAVNLWWAAGYNIVAIPLAAGVQYSAGIVLSPAFGAVLMSASTVIVSINARLLRFRRGTGSHTAGQPARRGAA